MVPKVRKMAMVVNRVKMEDKGELDVLYWLSKTPAERIAEVTRLINKDLKPGQRMDKTKFKQINLKDKL